MGSWQLGFAHDRDVQLVATTSTGNEAFRTMMGLPWRRPELVQALGFNVPGDTGGHGGVQIYARCVIRGAGREFVHWRYIDGQELERWLLKVATPVVASARLQGIDTERANWLVVCRKTPRTIESGGFGMDLSHVVAGIAASPKLKPLKNLQVYYIGAVQRDGFVMRCQIRAARNTAANPCGSFAA